MNKFSDLFRKRALLGVGVFCVAAIVTVGALSVGGNDGGDDPGKLADLNDQNPSGDDKQVADGTENPGDDKTPGKTDDKQVADGTENPSQSGDDKQVADGTENPNQTGDDKQVADGTQNPEQTGDDKQVADGDDKPDKTGDDKQVADGNDKPDKTGDDKQVADGNDKSDNQGKDDTQGTEVLSPQVIASQLTYNKASGLQWPIQGNVLIPYSPDHGVYYPTLDQFATSDAIVIASSVGTEVLAAAKGVVISMEEDVRTGMTVTLALGNNTQLIYGQLKTEELKVGDVVEAGECIGTVAEPTRYYVTEGANLYFQVMENGKSIDPTGLLK